MVSEAMKQTPEVLHHRPPQHLPLREVGFRSLVNEDTNVVHGRYIQMCNVIIVDTRAPWLQSHLRAGPMQPQAT